MALLLVFLFLFCAISCLSAPGITCALASLCPHNHDAAALLVFKNAITSDPLQILSDWKLPHTNCTSSVIRPCHWKGVTCKSSRVVALQLQASQLIGTVSPSLAELPFLRSLNLSVNYFAGRIPVELGKLNSSLISLDLSQNQLSGSIPVELGVFNQLTTLKLGGNELTGGVPVALASCTALTMLDLASNRLSGSIPVELGMLNQLGVLNLDENELTGGVPAALANCSALTDLSFSSNRLSGSIPAELGVLNQLGTLSLWNNELTGGVPAALANCTALVYLDLVGNRLSGSIPMELGMLDQLEKLYLFVNELTGAVPAALANCTALTELVLGANRLSGSIPLELGMIKKLDSLSVAMNELVGVIPPTLVNCTALRLLDFSSNQLSGNVIDVFDSLSSLAALNLSDNLFSGLLPSSLTRLKRLSGLYLNGNAFVGTIPELSSRLLNNLDLSNNNLSGPIPESLGTSLSGLWSFDLSHNLLSGPLPLSLGSLQQLTALNLSSNEFSGSIPSTLGSCAELLTLNLSHNKLTGKLPSSFASLRSLTEMDLSYNHLEGLVPNMNPFNDTNLVDLRENPMLCGPVVNRSCSASVQGSPRKASSKLKWTVSLAIAVVLAGLILVVGIVIWRHRNRIRDSDRRVYDALGRKLIKVSADELREATDGFSEANILGGGGVSTVYTAVLADGAVAVKILKPELVTRVSTDAEVARMKREVELLAMVRHRNIVRVRGCCFNLDMQAIILDLMPNGNLDTYLHGMQRQEALTKDEKLRLLRGIAHGLEYLHHWHDPGKTIVHCDVKPANVLLDEEWEPRIADFGIAKLLEQGDEVLQHPSASILLRGSIGYIPPEYASCTQVSSAGDVYSFGVVMLEILTGKRPTEVGSGSNVDGEQQQTLMSSVQAAYPYQLLGLFETPGMTQEDAIALAQLALSCTSPTRTRRPTMLQVGRALNAITGSLLSTDIPTLRQLVAE